jgi:hypothetical protein
MRRCSEPEDLFETISQTLLNAVDRDAYSGWGAMVTIMCVFSVQYIDPSADRLLQDTRQGHHPDAQGPHGLSGRRSECILCSNSILCKLHHALLRICLLSLCPTPLSVLTSYEKMDDLHIAKMVFSKLHCSIAFPPFRLVRDIMLATDRATAFPDRLIPRH